MVIQHNIAAMNANRNLASNNSALSKNLEKLSSGYRINRAGDDAAGLAISEKMRAQITGLNTAEDNANDGISLVQTAEGALTEVHSMLNRMVELADQSANGTYDDSTDRSNLQKELDSLTSEVDRISKSTNFNGINLLDGSLSGTAVTSTGTSVLGSSISTFSAAKATGQAAADWSAIAAGTDTFNVNGQSLSIDWTKGDAATIATKLDTDISSLSDDDGKALATSLTTLFNDQMSAQGVSGSVKVTFDTTANKFSIASTDTTSSSEVGFVGSSTSGSDIAIGSQLFGDGTNAAAVATAGKTVNSTIALGSSFAMTINGTTVQASTATAINEGDTLSSAATTIQTAVQAAAGAYNTALGYTATDANYLTAADFTVTADKTGALKVSYSGDADISFSFGESTDGATGTAGTTATKLGLNAATSSTGNQGLTLQIGDTADSFNKLTVSVGNMSSASLGLGSIDISTQEGASDALDTIKSAINSVSSTRGDLGAIQNRLEHTINNLSVTSENMTSAESRIRDVDMASEMMEYTKNNILTQASQSMLAQANQIPQGVLQLLQG